MAHCAPVESNALLSTTGPSACTVILLIPSYVYFFKSGDKVCGKSAKP